jgi:hypothetical protein
MIKNIKDLKCLFLLLFFVCVKGNSQTHENANIKAIVDSVNLTIKWDSSEIKISNSISDNKIWLDVLSRDSIFIKYVKKLFNTNACIIYIGLIEAKSDFNYEFLMYCRPKNVKPSEMRLYGYAYYDVLIFKQNASRFKIVSIKFTRIAI